MKIVGEKSDWQERLGEVDKMRTLEYGDAGGLRIGGWESLAR